MRFPKEARGICVLKILKKPLGFADQGLRRSDGHLRWWRPLRRVSEYRKARNL